MSFSTDKELIVLSNILRNPSVTQRELARKGGISLGLINVIIQKFNDNGYLSVSHPNKRKMKYTLTPKGLFETFRRAYSEATNTIRNYNLIRSKLEGLLKTLHEKGYDYFSIHGDSEIRDLLISAFQTSLGESPVTLGGVHRDNPRAIILNVTPEPLQEGFKGNVLNVMEGIGV